MSFTLPRDNNNAVIQALCPVTTSGQNISSGGAVRLTLAAGTDIIRIAAAMSCFIKFGDSGVTATTSDLLFPVGAEFFSIKDMGYTHVSFLGVEPTPAPASISRMV